MLQCFLVLRVSRRTSRDVVNDGDNKGRRVVSCFAFFFPISWEKKVHQKNRGNGIVSRHGKDRVGKKETRQVDKLGKDKRDTLEALFP